VQFEDKEELDEWLEFNAETLFESALEGWYTDPDSWPKDRSMATFKAWCTLELHTMVINTGVAPLDDDDEARYRSDSRKRPLLHASGGCERVGRPEW
jgi:hypothetical protein